MQDLLNKNISKDVNVGQRLGIVKHVRQFGDLNTNAILDSACNFFSIPTVNGFIGYRIEANCAIVFGDPLCLIKDQIALTEAFKHYCKSNQLSIVSTIISQDFAKTAKSKLGSISIPFGHKLILDPQDNPIHKTGPKASLVRRKAKHALKDKVSIHEYKTDDPNIENAIKEVGDVWLKSRKGPQIFIAHQNFFSDTYGKRWFYAKLGEKVVGFLILNMIKSGDGWLLNNLIIASDSPSGTSELLITSTLEILKNEHCKYVIVGPVTAKEIDQIEGLGNISLFLSRLFFKIAKSVFRLDRQTMFWDKFQAKSENSYLIFEKVNIQSLKALLYAMNVQI